MPNHPAQNRHQTVYVHGEANASHAAMVVYFANRLYAEYDKCILRPQDSTSWIKSAEGAIYWAIAVALHHAPSAHYTIRTTSRECVATLNHLWNSDLSDVLRVLGNARETDAGIIQRVFAHIEDCKLAWGTKVTLEVVGARTHDEGEVREKMGEVVRRAREALKNALA